MFEDMSLYLKVWDLINAKSNSAALANVAQSLAPPDLILGTPTFRLLILYYNKINYLILVSTF
jgi:hypothetical protein